MSDSILIEIRCILEAIHIELVNVRQHLDRMSTEASKGWLPNDERESSGSLRATPLPSEHSEFPEDYEVN